MSFQDELRANHRTKDEIDDESGRKDEKEMRDEARKTINSLKAGLLSEAGAGCVTGKDGVIIVKAHARIPREFLIERKERTQPVYRRSLFGKSVLVSPGNSCVVYSLNKSGRYELFMDHLGRMAEFAGIEIIKPVLHDRKTGEIFDLPCTLSGFPSLDRGIFVLCSSGFKAGDPGKE